MSAASSWAIRRIADGVPERRSREDLEQRIVELERDLEVSS